MIKINNLWKKYGEITALDNVTIELPSTGFIFVNGKSGSGKTTLMNLLSGLIFPSSGEMFYGNRNLVNFDSKDWAEYRNSTIGVVFQTFNFIDDFTVAENLRLPLLIQEIDEEVIEERIREILEYVELSGYENHKVNELSAGQKQRIAIARAVIKRPKVILADEATGNLDYINSQYVLDLFNKISRECLVILISHDKSSAEKYGDRIITLSEGKVVSDVDNRMVKNLSITPYIVSVNSENQKINLPIQEFDIRKIIQQIGNWKDGNLKECEFTTTITREDNLIQKEKSFQWDYENKKTKRLGFRQLKKLISHTLKRKRSKNLLIVCISAFITLLLIVAQIIMWNDYSDIMLNYIKDKGSSYYKVKQNITTKEREYDLEKGKRFLTELTESVSEKRILKVSEECLFGKGNDDCLVDKISFNETFFNNINVEGSYPKGINDIIINSKLAEEMNIHIGDTVTIEDTKYNVTGLFDLELDDNYRLVSITPEAISHMLYEQNFIGMQSCDVTKSVSFNDYIAGIQTLGSISEIDSKDLIYGHMPKKDNEIIISSDLARDIGYFDNGIIVTKYRLRDLYDKKYEGEYSEYFNLYDYLGKDVEVVGIYNVDGMDSEMPNISLSNSKYQKILSDYAEYFNYGCTFVDMRNCDTNAMDKLLNKNFYIDNDTCKFIFLTRKFSKNMKVVIVGASIVFLAVIMCIIIAFMSFSVKEAGKQIGIYKSIGICDKDLRLLFVIQNIFLNGIAVVLATLFSYFTIRAINLKIQSMSSFHNFEVIVSNPLVIVLVCVIVLLITFLATVLPMKKLLQSESLLLINENDI